MATSASKALFTPIQVGRYTLKHRVALAPLTRNRADNGKNGTEENVPNELMTTYYTQRASDGGLLISEGTAINAEGRHATNTGALYSKAQIEGWKPVTKAVHEKGAIFFTQLWHVGRNGHSTLDPLGRPPASSGTVQQTGTTFDFDFKSAPFETPRALTTVEVQEVVRDFAQAAKNAIEAGFDGVEIHGANGYLIDQFLNDNVNVGRTDQYGGPIENRIRLAVEVVQATVDAIGADRVAIRFSPFGKYNDMDDSTRLETWTAALKALNPLNLAYVHLMGVPSSDGSLAALRKAYNGVLIVAAGYSAESAENEVVSGNADIIAFGRFFTSNPDLPERILKGREFTHYDWSTFYRGNDRGYTDFKTWQEAQA